MSWFSHGIVVESHWLLTYDTLVATLLDGLLNLVPGPHGCLFRLVIVWNSL